MPEVAALIEVVRDATSARILEGLGASGTPRARAVARGWLWFMDGALADWLDHRELTRAELRDLLLGVLSGALRAAGEPRPAALIP